MDIYVVGNFAFNLYQIIDQQPMAYPRVKLVVVGDGGTGVLLSLLNSF